MGLKRMSGQCEFAKVEAPCSKFTLSNIFLDLTIYVFICRGVNMYTMLTGTLPFTVEPFSLKALHQRMVDKDMNPLPPSISSGIDRNPSENCKKIFTRTSNYNMLKISLCTPTNYILMGIMLQKLSMNAVFVIFLFQSSMVLLNA